MAITIQRIAEIAGVSRGTVDRALHGRGRVKKEVSDRIYRIAEENGYMLKHPRGRHGTGAPGQSGPSGQSPLSGHTGLPGAPGQEGVNVRIGIITQLSHSPFMRRVNQGIEDITKELAGRNIEVTHEETATVDEETQLRLIDKLVLSGIQGLAIMPVDSDRIRIRLNQLCEKGVPVITFNSDIAGTARRCFVGLDNKKSGRTAAGLMGLMTGGRGKILAITGYFSNSASSMRVDGFIEESRRSFKDMELTGVQSSLDDAGEVERIIRSAMKANPGLAGIFVASGGQSGILKAFEAIKPQKRPYVIIYDRTRENETALFKDAADFLIDQEGYVQGYRPLRLLSDLILLGKEPQSEYIYTDITILTKYNL